MGRIVFALVAACACVTAASASAAGWTSSVPFTNVVASSPTVGASYPDDATGAPVPGTCGSGSFNSNRSESWLAVQPGTENIVGTSKFFYGPWSAFYNFDLGSYTIPNGVPAGNNQVQGYDCVSTGTQAMPPSWTNNTDPNAAWDLEGRVYQTTLPFNAYWTNLHPNSAIDVSYSDDMGRHWIKGNGGKDLEQSPNASSLQLGHVEDKEWIAVNDDPLSPYRDHVYAMWSVFNNNTTKIRIAVSRDRGQTFSKAVTITAPSQTGPSNTYIYPSVDASGDVYIAFVSFPLNKNKAPTTIYVSRSTDDGQTFRLFLAAVRNVGVLSATDLPNTIFRDGITESFAASPTYPGHLYLAYEDWDGTQMDVKFTQSTDGGLTWSTPAVVNDAANSSTTDQFQPAVAAGPNGAVAVAFYDRRQACPNDKSIFNGDAGQSNFCIDTSMQPYKDSGAGAVPVGANVRISKYSWDPDQPQQHVGGIGQYPCAAHTDPCTSDGFIGDYFGLAVSTGNIYALMISTHYPSTVTADEGGPVYYQQQILATVPRTDFGTGY
jgi:hypothetical protein